MKHLSFCLIAMLGACSRLPTRETIYPAVVSQTIHGDDRCAEDQRSALEGAAQAYFQITDGRARLQIKWDLSDSTIMSLASEPIAVCSDHLPVGVGGQTNGDIIVLGRCPDEYACALHEMGHFLGLQHLERSHGVMSPVNPARSFSSGDLAELKRVGLYKTPDRTTVRMTVDPTVPNVEPEYP